MSIADIMVSVKPLSTGATAVFPYTDEIAKFLTFNSRFGDIVKLYERDTKTNMVHVPRALCPVSDNDERVAGDNVQFNCNVVPRNAEQARVIDEMSSFLKSGLSGIVEAPTGMGKTVMACSAIAEVGKKTLIVVTKEDLMMAEDQWYGALKTFLNLKPNDIGIIRQDSCHVAGKKVVLAMLHSLCIDGRYPDWIRNEFGLIVFDEVHRLGAEQFSKVCGMFPAKLRLGLSATPDRKDGKEIVFMAHIGPVRVRAQQLQLVPKVLIHRSTWYCPRVYQVDPLTKTKKLVRLPHTPGRLGRILTSICNDKDRNKLLTEILVACYLKGRTTVFFTELLEHVDTIYAMLQGSGVPSKDMAKYVGGLSGDERNVAKGRKIMLATYKMMGEGTNIPWLDTCVFGTPRSDIVQIIGRILREYPDKKQPVAIDVQDTDSPVLKGYSAARLAYYRQIGAEIKHIGSINPT